MYLARIRVAEVVEAVLYIDVGDSKPFEILDIDVAPVDNRQSLEWTQVH